MRLTSQNNQFVCSLPRDFINKKVVEIYKTFIDKVHCQYDDILDYLNSTIKGISFPGINVETPEQTIIRGKTIAYKDSKNVQDILNKDITITFKSVDSHANYWMIYHMFIDHYLDVERDNYPNNIFSPPIIMAILDWNRDALFYISFDKIQLKSISDVNFDYSDTTIEDKSFSLNFVFNFFEMEYVFTKTHIMRTHSPKTYLEYEDFFSKTNKLKNNLDKFIP